MVKHPLHVLAIAAVVALGTATQAAAQCCPACDCGPGPRSYLVNQGPVFSGPGHYVAQIPDPAPRKYPYVGFVYNGYPYGYYRPWIGAPYAGPRVTYRYRPAPVYYRQMGPRPWPTVR